MEQGADGQRVELVRRLHDPELGEARELLGLAKARLQGQPAGRDAVAGPAPDGTEVAGALEDQELLERAAGPRRIEDAEAREAGLGRQGFWRLHPAKVEHGRIVAQLTGRAALDEVDAHLLAKEAAQMHRTELERRRPELDGTLGQHADRPLLLQRELAQPVGRLRRWRPGLRRQRPRLLDQPLERERLWLAQAHSTVGGPCRIREGQ